MNHLHRYYCFSLKMLYDELLVSVGYLEEIVHALKVKNKHSHSAIIL